MWLCQRLRFSLSLNSRFQKIRWKSDVVAEEVGESSGGLRKEANRRFSHVTLKRLHFWDRMDRNDWLMIYRDNYASRFILLTNLAVPFVALMTSEQFTTLSKSSQLVDVLNESTLFQQMGNFVIIPFSIYILLVFLTLRMNYTRLHRIYASRKDQKTFIAIASRYVLFTQKIPFTRHNFRILECATHSLWSLLKGTIRVNKRRFTLHDDGFRDIRYRSLLLGRFTKNQDDTMENVKTPNRTMI